MKTHNFTNFLKLAYHFMFGLITVCHLIFFFLKWLVCEVVD